MKAVMRYKNGLNEITPLEHCSVYPTTIRLSIHKGEIATKILFDRRGELRNGTPLYIERSKSREAA